MSTPSSRSNSTNRPLRPTHVLIRERPRRHDDLYRQTRGKENAQEKPPHDEVGIDPALLDWVRLRLAQIRLRPDDREKHRLDLLARGESKERLGQLETWREASRFSSKEEAAFALAEAVSLKSLKTTLDQCLEVARRHFPQEEFISLLLAIMAANAGDFEAGDGATERTRRRPAPENAEEQSISPYWRKLAHRLSTWVIFVEET